MMRATMPPPIRQDDLDQLARHYGQLVREHGDSPQAGQWADLITQERRLDVLMGVGDLRRARVLDLGCGTAHLLTMLRARDFAGEYVGYDISEEVVAHARRKFPGVRFDRRNVLADGLGEPFDYVFLSGLFNNRLPDNWGFMTALLRAAFDGTRVALAFNNLSTYVDFFDPGLYYVSPEEVFRFCKTHLSPQVTLRHDYQVRPGVLPYEFSTYVFVSTISCRPPNQPPAAATPSR
jgi:SAM-dependent methyltransferase